MNKTIIETAEFVKELKKAELPEDRTAVICAPFTALPTLQQLLSGTTLRYGAQNVHWEEQGAFTGEISAPMLTEVGCQFVIIGHSERRRDQQETDTIVQRKVQLALKHHLTPVICVGESLLQRQVNQTESVIQQQLAAALDGLTAAQLANVVIAYEPIWAIGTGESATAEQAQAVHAAIRHQVTATTPIIYGGSVTTENIAELMQQPDINGALVGGASLDVAKFLQIIQY